MSRCRCVSASVWTGEPDKVDHPRPAFGQKLSRSGGRGWQRWSPYCRVPGPTRSLEHGSSLRGALEMNRRSILVLSTRVVLQGLAARPPRSAVELELPSVIPAPVCCLPVSVRQGHFESLNPSFRKTVLN